MARHSGLSFWRDLRYRFEYLGLRFLIGIVRLLPLDIAATISGKIWRLVAPYNRRHKRALSNLATAFPEKTEEERERIARAACTSPPATGLAVTRTRWARR